MLYKRSNEIPLFINHPSVIDEHGKNSQVSCEQKSWCVARSPMSVCVCVCVCVCDVCKLPTNSSASSLPPSLPLSFLIWVGPKELLF
jgi:hypothetical protein